MLSCCGMSVLCFCSVVGQSSPAGRAGVRVRRWTQRGLTSADCHRSSLVSQSSAPPPLVLHVRVRVCHCIRCRGSGQHATPDTAPSRTDAARKRDADGSESGLKMELTPMLESVDEKGDTKVRDSVSPHETSLNSHRVLLSEEHAQLARGAPRDGSPAQHSQRRQVRTLAQTRFQRLHERQGRGRNDSRAFMISHTDLLRNIRVFLRIVKLNSCSCSCLLKTTSWHPCFTRTQSGQRKQRQSRTVPRRRSACTNFRCCRIACGRSGRRCRAAVRATATRTLARAPSSQHRAPRAIPRGHSRPSARPPRPKQTAAPRRAAGLSRIE